MAFHANLPRSRTPRAIVNTHSPLQRPSPSRSRHTAFTTWGPRGGQRNPCAQYATFGTQSFRHCVAELEGRARAAREQGVNRVRQLARGSRWRWRWRSSAAEMYCRGATDGRDRHCCPTTRWRRRRQFRTYGHRGPSEGADLPAAGSAAGAVAGRLKTQPPTMTPTHDRETPLHDPLLVAKNPETEIVLLHALATVTVITGERGPQDGTCR